MFPVFYNQVDSQQSADSLLIGLFAWQHLDRRKKTTTTSVHHKWRQSLFVAGVVEGYRNALLSESRIKMWSMKNMGGD